ncbi:hypothetical protein F5Y13DRAFT_152288 [Hypoxylon sp. FL1857]|nr:hypothetical protein F5Y13DRAFT_152288 [Hypoxylon sp. FL1857]
MSERPYNYGQYPGQHPNSQPPVSFTQPLPSQNPHSPYYGAFQQPVPTLGNYATVNNSFQYNASSIPGLGMANPQPPVPYRPENNATWQPQPQLQTTPHNVVPAQTVEKAATTASEQRGLLKTSQVQTEDTLEEGELSEGEFEDLYEPRDTVGAAVPAPPSPRPPSATENQNGSVGDADGSSIYDGATPQGEALNSTSTSLPAAEQEYSPDEDWEPAYQDRERSGSYSPYLSPREIQRKVSVSKPASQGTKQVPTTQHSLQPLPGITMIPVQNPAAEAPQSNGVPQASTKDPALVFPFRSVAEAKKKAQEAILGLWPLKVRYQDYIEEGFDEKLIKGLFTDLGLEASIPKSTAAQKTTGNSDALAATSEPSKAIPESQDPKGESSTALKPKQPTTTNSTVNTNAPGDAKTAEKTAAEERKDKIARKLAAKAQKTVAPVQPAVPTPPSQPTPANVSITTSSSVSPAKAKTRAENNAILYQKLAALKRAQEEKAAAEKKQASENVVQPTTTPIVPPKDSVAIPSVKNNGEAPANPPTSTIPQPEPNRRSVSTEKSLPRDGSIPGLFLVTQPAQPANRNLKRPVASDFDNYPNTAGTLKRTRTQETLIIDVSDDEDVEMDIGSPTDEPNSSNEIINQPSRQTPLGAFPPLSDSSNWKQRSSPSSSVPTPPVHGAKLDLLNKRIEEAKRRIAEAEAKKAEAKKAIKRVNASQSPQVQPLPTESVTPPKVSGGSQTVQEAKTGNVERRDRIVSFELPTLDATLREKQVKLKQAVAEAAKLQLEIQASLEERRKLAAEVEKLVDSPPTTTEVSDQATVDPSASSTIDSYANHVAESQLPNGQQPSPGEDGDVTMAEVEDSSDHDQGTTSNEIQSSPKPPQPNLPADDQSLAATAQSSQNSAAAENENNSMPPKDSPIDVAADQNVADTNGMVDAVETRNEGRDQVGVDTTEQSPRDSSPQINGSRESQPTPPSLTHDATSSGPEDDPARPLSPQEQSNLVVGEQSTDKGLNDLNPAQTTRELILSVPENPVGEVQNSSSHEPPLLTSTQDEPELEQRPQLEDLLSYRSPLGYFRAYRFHPKYFDEVAGGLKSMTYSSKIDPMRPVCPYALSGEQCPDGNNCEFQHFESMVLPDAEIITQLGSADMFAGETRNRFIEGLKKVLNDLKANKVKDFDRITRAIVKHRQEFLEDKSKVLPLDAGTS